MIGRRLTTQDQMVDLVAAEILGARTSELEIAETADSFELYAKLRARIASASETQISRAQIRAGLFHGWRLVVSPLAIAASVLLLIALVLILCLPKASNERAVLAPQSPLPSRPGPVESTKPGSTQEPASVVKAMPAATKRTSQRRLKSNYQNSEVATDFLPLTFIADSAAQESGHVVRVRVPRSALIAFGVPMNVERAGEFIMADVMIGDDGLARAIRFVQ
jgi:negative regulator of sigma E activity